MSNIRVGVVGASGYTGLELIKILINHPIFELSYIATSEGNSSIEALHPALIDIFTCRVEQASCEDMITRCDLVFLALPHKTAMAYVKELRGSKVKIVDLSADYRLELKRYERHYTTHIDKEGIAQSVYGLPELNRDLIKESDLVANPGCYPTSAILAILPFLEYIKAQTPIVIDAKSGVSGAGKKLSDTTHYVSINENIHAYSPLTHRHFPEIAEKLMIEESRIHFVPHLIPITRGMLSSVYLQVEGDFDANEVAKSYYKDDYFVRVVETLVDVKRVAGTNFCDIFVQRRGDMLFISSAIDNLLRGASSQAVVNANLMCGLDENLAIPTIAYVP